MGNPSTCTHEEAVCHHSWGHPRFRLPLLIETMAVINPVQQVIQRHGLTLKKIKCFNKQDQVWKF